MKKRRKPHNREPLPIEGEVAEKGVPENACILGERSSKRKGLALNTFKAAAQAPAATRLCPEPRNAKNKVESLRSLFIIYKDPSHPLKRELPQSGSLLRKKHNKTALHKQGGCFFSSCKRFYFLRSSFT